MLSSPLPALEDPEGTCCIEDLPPVTDAHVHLFPDALFASIRAWFDRNGWPIRYRLPATRIAPYLLERGVRRVVVMCYAHRPGVARELNRFMSGVHGTDPRITALACVHPEEDGVEKILEEAFERGLSGVKLHAHVQCVRVDSPSVVRVAAVCRAHGKPMVFHAGREPKSPAYNCDPHVLCGAAMVENLLKSTPGLKLCVPHLGMDEYGAFRRLLERYDHLWLDTTMTLSSYFPGAAVPDLSSYRPDRLMYGTDFPNIPYAWDRELAVLSKMGLDEEDLSRILGGNAADFFSLWEGGPEFAPG